MPPKIPRSPPVRNTGAEDRDADDGDTKGRTAIRPLEKKAQNPNPQLFLPFYPPDDPVTLYGSQLS